MTDFVFAAVATAALDSLTKELASAHLVEGRLYGVSGAAGLRLLRNPRGALVGLPVGMAAVVWLLAAVSAGTVVRMAPGAAAVGWGLGAAMGGAFGNLLDRVVRRSVVDFVAVGSWPVFNVADAAIVVGLTVAFVRVA